MAAVVYFMFFAESFDRPDVRQEYHYNLILFKEIKRFIIYRDQLGMKAVFLNIVGNVALFSAHYQQKKPEMVQYGALWIQLQPGH